MSDMMQTGFDYGVLPIESASRLQEIKRDIAIIDTLACVQIGQKLKEAQLELNMRGKSGAGFQEWVEAETPYALTAAYEMIRINTRFGENDMRNSAHHFSYSVLARLAAPSTPESVIDRAIEQAEAGDKVTVADVKQWKESAQAASQRAEEFREESNARRKKIRELEQQVDLLKASGDRLRRPSWVHPIQGSYFPYMDWHSCRPGFPGQSEVRKHSSNSFMRSRAFWASITRASSAALLPLSLPPEQPKTTPVPLCRKHVPPLGITSTSSAHTDPLTAVVSATANINFLFIAASSLGCFYNVTPI